MRYRLIELTMTTAALSILVWKRIIDTMTTNKMRDESLEQPAEQQYL